MAPTARPVGGAPRRAVTKERTANGDSDMAGAGRIDDYVTSLGRGLHGPRRIKRDLLAEARDSLTDAAEALEADGLGRAEAERAAVAGFGAVEEVAPAYQAELAAGQGRRTAVLLFLSVPLTSLMWSVIWVIFPWDARSAALVPAWFTPLARAIDWVQIAAGVMGALALLSLGRVVRRIRDPRVVTRGLGIMILIQVPLIGVASLALSFAASPLLTDFADFTPGQVVTFLSYFLSGWLVCSAVRCLRASRRTAAPYAREEPRRVTA